MEAPGEHRYGNGWMLGMVEGHLFYSDGSGMFLCKTEEPPTPNCKLPEGHMAFAFKGCVPKKLLPTKLVKRVVKQAVPSDKMTEVMVFKGRTGIDIKYYEHVVKNYNAKWFLGKVQDKENGMRALVAMQENGLIVAVVMPFRYR